MGMYFENGLLSFTNNSTRRMSVSTNGVVYIIQMVLKYNLIVVLVIGIMV
jgi:hypothetical protein